MPAGNAGRFLVCPHCQNGSVLDGSGRVFPAAPAGGEVAGLPQPVADAWLEARTAFGGGACTAAEMMCRKILMYVAVDKSAISAGKSFVEYVDALEAAGYITTGLKPAVDQIRKRGNVANHELPSSTREEAAATFKITEHLLRGIYELPI